MDEKPETALTFFLSGDLDTQNSHDFIKFFDTVDQLEAAPRRIILDCKNLHYVSSTGVGSFTSILVKCRQRSIELFLSRVPAKVTDVLSLLGFSRYFPILDGEPS
ncbi:MAG: STAS domain-containing protein [bacterium]